MDYDNNPLYVIAAFSASGIFKWHSNYEKYYLYNPEGTTSKKTNYMTATGLYVNSDGSTSEIPDWAFISGAFSASGWQFVLHVGSIIWANFNIHLEDGTVYLSASEPVPIYE